MNTANRVLIIGLDGLGPQALDALLARGALPVIGGLISRGVRGVLASTVPPVTCPAWPTMCTGVGPGRHGVFSFVRREADGRARLASSADIAAPRFWQLAAAAGRRVATLYVPTMFPADAVLPLAVSGYPAPEREGAGSVHPPDAEAPLRAAIPAFQASPFLAFRAQGDESPQDARRRVITGAARADAHRVTTAFDYACRQGPPDLAMAVFSFPDHLFHAYYAAVTAGEGATEDLLDVRAAVDDAFRLIDEAVGRLVAGFGEPAAVLLVSDHGLVAKRGSLLVAEALRQAGLLKSAGLKYLLRRAMRARRTQDIRHNLMADDPWTDAGLDWSRTRALAGYDHEQAVFVNLAGRNPAGIVRPEQYDGVCSQVRDALLAVRDPATGDRPVRAVRRRDELYAGPYVNLAPDMVLELADGWQVRRKLAWRMRGRPPLAPHTGPGGVHHPDGILIAAGDAVRPGARVEGAQIADIGATVLALAGLAPPEPLDGRPLEDVFAFPSTQERVHPAAAAPAEGYSEADEDEVARRLEDLGYL
jgi:predicted AlkP superfamily phosphohydrolase/phosphomutase